jgi:hypothetical protein
VVRGYVHVYIHGFGGARPDNERRRRTVHPGAIFPAGAEINGSGARSAGAAAASATGRASASGAACAWASKVALTVLGR